MHQPQTNPRSFLLRRQLAALLVCVGVTQCHSGGSSGTPANSIIIKAARAAEGIDQVEVVLARTAFVAGPVSLRYETVDATATAPQDYVAAAGTVTWAADDRADKTISIRIEDDPWIEGVEQFALQVLEVRGGVAAGSATISITIDDDDGSVQAGWQAHRRLLTVASPRSSAAIGDVDGDGVTDLGIGDPTADANRGRVQVLSGRTGATILEIPGTAPDDYLGTLVAGPGDLDGDATPDVLAYGSDGFNWLVRAFSGADGRRLYQITGDPLDIRSVSSITGIADVDADGKRDFAIGLPLDTAKGPARVGVFSGADGRRIRWLSAPTFGESFGAAVAGVADLNGDQIDDVLVGAPKATGVAPNSGAVYVYSGAGGQQLARIAGTIADSGFGLAVASAGDTDGDSVPDILVGAPDADGSAGAVYVFDGASRLLLRSITGASAGGRLGAAVAAAGDLDGDSYGDLLLGAPGAREVVVHGGVDGRRLLRLLGEVADFGRAVGVLGDTNDDGAVDFAVAASGEVAVLSTAKLPLAADVSAISIAQPGKQSWSLDAGTQHAGRLYWVVGSFGTSPGFDIGLVHVPLNNDPWFEFTLLAANTQVLENSRGTLDEDGRARASINTPKVTVPATAGVTVYFAYLVYGVDATPYLASNAVPLRFVK